MARLSLDRLRSKSPVPVEEVELEEPGTYPGHGDPADDVALDLVGGQFVAGGSGDHLEFWAALAALCPEADGVKLRLPRDICRAMRASAGLGRAPRGDAALKDALAECGEIPVRALCCLSRTDGQLDRVLGSGTCIYPRALAVTGRDIPQRGAAAGRCLSALLAHVHRCPEDNRREILLKMAEEMEDG